MIQTSYGQFKITFDNGYTISIVNGYGSYTENHYNQKLLKKMKNLRFIDFCESEDCEVAILYEDEFCTRSFIETNDSSIGYIKSDELADLIMKVKNAE